MHAKTHVHVYTCVYMKNVHEKSSLLECDSNIGQVANCILKEHSALIFKVKQSKKME